MKPIAIIAREGHEIGKELLDGIALLRTSGIYPRTAQIGPAFALVWVDDEQISNGVSALRTAGFKATELIEADML